MKKASELRKELSALGLDEDDVNGAIQKAVSKGTVQDDESDGGGGEDYEKLDKAVSALDKALSALEQSGTETREAMAKGGSAGVDPDNLEFGGGEDVTAQIEAIARGAVAMEKAVHRQHAVATDALSAIAKGMAAQSAVIKAQGRALARVERQNAELAKALGAPMPPRSLTGATIVEHPAEAAKAGADEGEQFIAKAMNEIRNPATDMGRRQALSKAISMVQEGIPVATAKSGVGL